MASNDEDAVGTRISLPTLLWMVTGYAIAFGIDRAARLDGFTVLIYGGFLTLAGLACNRMPVFVVGVATTVAVVLLHA